MQGMQILMLLNLNTGYADTDANPDAINLNTGYADTDAEPMLLNLNTGYTDTDAELCIRMMSVCCTLWFAKRIKDYLTVFFVYTLLPNY